MCKKIVFLFTISVLMFMFPDKKSRILILFFASIINFAFKLLHYTIMAFCIISIGSLFNVFTIDEALNGFSNPLIWLIIMYLILSKALIKTGISKRIALYIVYFFGKNTLMLSYGIVLLTTVFACIFPTSTARIGGIIIPILTSIFEVLDEKDEKIKTNIILNVLYGNTVASTIFFAASSVNLYIQNILHTHNIIISGLVWMKLAIIPGILTLLAIPLIIQLFTTKQIRNTEKLQAKFKAEIDNLPKFSFVECLLILIAIIFIGLWFFSFIEDVNLLIFMLISTFLMLDLLNVKEDILMNKEIWSFFFWFSNILMISSFITKYNAFDAIIYYLTQFVDMIPNQYKFITILIIYGYTQYLFTSSTIHVAAFFEICFQLIIKYNFSFMSSVLCLVYTSNLFAGLTNYSATETILLSKKYKLNPKKFLKTGFIITSIIFIIFISIGKIWWKVLGV